MHAAQNAFGMGNRMVELYPFLIMPYRCKLILTIHAGKPSPVVFKRRQIDGIATCKRCRRECHALRKFFICCRVNAACSSAGCRYHPMVHSMAWVAFSRGCQCNLFIALLISSFSSPASCGCTPPDISTQL